MKYERKEAVFSIIQFYLLFHQIFIQYLICNYTMLGDTENTRVNKTDMASVLIKLKF